MDPNTALELVKRGATLLLLDVPQYTLIGIDTQMFLSGPNFNGVKMIPPGVHFIYYSSSNKEGNEFSAIVGFFIDASPSQVIVRKWEQKEERFVKLLEEEEEIYSDAVKRLEFDKKLGPYTLSQYRVWKHLSNYITKDTIERIQPIGGEITIACESEMVGKYSKTSMEKILSEQLKNSKFSTPEDKSKNRGCYYTTIPRVVKHKGMSSQELTNLNMDKTQLLESILIKEYGGDENGLLAELQFAFIAFLMGQSLEAFLQWKLLVTLLFSCTEAPLHTRSQLFTKFVEVLYYQLKYGLQKGENEIGAMREGVSALLDESWLSSDSFLHLHCKDFFILVLEAPVVDGDLLSWRQETMLEILRLASCKTPKWLIFSFYCWKTRKLKELLEDSLGWQFGESSSRGDEIYFDEDDEYAPVIEVINDANYTST